MHDIHTIDPDEAARLVALSELELVGTPPEERFDRITRLARELFDVPVAEINLIDEAWQFTKSPQREDSSPLSDRLQSFCDLTIRQPGMLVVNDATQDERFAHKTTVTGPRHIRFYAGRPLAVESGERVGTLCLVDTEPRSLDDSQLRVLEELAVWVERELQENVERVTATSVQQQLFPHGGELVPGYEIAGLTMPFHHIGGDFYSWSAEGHTLELTLADVMGKGLGAALMAATVRTTIAATSTDDLAATLQSANASLLNDFAATGTFATAFHARLDASTGALSFVDAGHGLTLVVRAGDGFERLSSLGLPLGIAADAQWTAATTFLHPGDMVIAVTDGVLDLFDGTLASLESLHDLVRGRLTADRPPRAQEVVDIIGDLAHRSRRTDDTTVVVVSRVR